MEGSLATRQAPSSAAAGDPGPTVEPAAEAAAPPAGAQRFGRLEAVRIRDHWKDEARDFTPWLAEEENLALLGETLGLNLELVGMEQRVGPFKADIVARDEDNVVIVENQLDATDHRHLGQLMVYAAGRRADTVVWIAREVTDEYRKVIDWLNAETSTNFWALEVELWRIGSSPVAPKFNVACEPNELAKAVKEESAELTEMRVAQLEFWKGFSQYLAEAETSLSPRKAFPQNWYDLSIGTSRAHVSCTILMSKTGRLGCELYIPGSSHPEVIFEALMNDKTAIEGELGELDWQDLPKKKACRIADHKNPVDLEDRERWPELYQWLGDRAEAFKQAFAPRIRDINIPETRDEVVGAQAAAGAVAPPPKVEGSRGDVA